MKGSAGYDVKTTVRISQQYAALSYLSRFPASFIGNPHIVAATKHDYTLPIPQAQSTFPEPLPSYLPRTVKVPTASIPKTDLASANAGRFSVSLKGMRRDLRRAGGKAEALVRDVETAIVEWLTEGGTVLRPDHVNSGLQSVGKPVELTGAIVEVSRTPLQLIWRITDDAFARYIVHCCARYHEVVSFSKSPYFLSRQTSLSFIQGRGTDQNRLTYLLRPNVTRPDRRACAALETPPVTDLEYSSNPDTDIDTDLISEGDLGSDSEQDHNNALPAIAESPSPLPPVPEDNWFLVAEEEEVGDDEVDSGSEVSTGLEISVDILQTRLEKISVGPTAIQPSVTVVGKAQGAGPLGVVIGADRALTDIRPNPLQSGSPRRRDWAPLRSSSSPSRSPIRVRRRRRARVNKRAADGLPSSRSFYNYLFR